MLPRLVIASLYLFALSSCLTPDEARLKRYRALPDGLLVVCPHGPGSCQLYQASNLQRGPGGSLIFDTEAFSDIQTTEDWTLIPGFNPQEEMEKRLKQELERELKKRNREEEQREREEQKS